MTQNSLANQINDKFSGFPVSSHHFVRLLSHQDVFKTNINYSKLVAGALVAFATVGGGLAISEKSVRAQTTTTDPVTAVGTAVTQAESVIEKLGGLSASALAIALIPLGTMLSLRFLNMILSRV